MLSPICFKVGIVTKLQCVVAAGVWGGERGGGVGGGVSFRRLRPFTLVNNYPPGMSASQPLEKKCKIDSSTSSSSSEYPHAHRRADDTSLSVPAAELVT